MANEQDDKQKPQEIRQRAHENTNSKHRVAEDMLLVTLALSPLSYEGLFSRGLAGMYDTPDRAQLRKVRAVHRSSTVYGGSKLKHGAPRGFLPRDFTMLISCWLRTAVRSVRMRQCV